jgi:competence protein ComGC
MASSNLSKGTIETIGAKQTPIRKPAYHIEAPIINLLILSINLSIPLPNLTSQQAYVNFPSL